MLAFVLRTMGTVGTMLGVLGIVWGVAGLSTPIIVTLWGVALASVGAVVVDLLVLLRNRPHRFPPNDPAIIGYMLNWLSAGGRTAIFTRDMSWATPGSDVASLLASKAGRGELLLFVSSVLPLVETLKQAGAEVYIYPTAFIPKARFTIIDYEKHGARVAIGVVENKKHTIREHDLASSHLSPVLVDLVALAKAAGKKVK